MGELERISFRIIAAVGGARSSYIEAMRAARAGDLERADALIKQGDESFLGGHDAHTELIQREAGGDPVQMNLMITHAEDQLMSAETIKIVALELIELYRDRAKEAAQATA